MKKRIFWLNTLIIACSLLAFFAINLFITYEDNINFAEDTVKNYAEIYSDFYSKDRNLNEFVSGVDSLKDNLRITVISSNGTVLKDSGLRDETVLENHLSRDEVQAALKSKPKVVIRYSSTLDKKLMYYALKVNIGDDYVFIRAATPISSINSYIMRSLPILLLIIFIILLASFFLIDRITEKLLAPFNLVKNSLQSINEGVYEKIILNSNYEEVNQIVSEINYISEKLEVNISELVEEKNKLDYIMDNINNGIFAVDNKLNIKFINSKARWIFDTTVDVIDKNLSYLTFHSKLMSSIDNCICKQQSVVFELEHKGYIYIVSIKNLYENSVEQCVGQAVDKCVEPRGAKLCMIILSDITEIKKNQRLREEFFSNASHELKTPLTVIKGFNELTAINNKDEKLDKFISQIAKETDRMIALIGDMLRLSELENTKKLNVIDIKLQDVAEEIKDNLENIILEKNIKVEIIGEGTVKMEEKHAYEFIKNLIENATKYNKEDGSVMVSIKEARDTVEFKVADTGIGIPEEHQSRIFERFYRVEKSRSRQSGGTGLGLSIVKHICNLYGAELTIKSKLNVGTEIKVLFKTEKAL